MISLDPVLVPMPAAGVYRLLHGLRFTVDGEWICNVPPNFTTDGASIPRLLWRVTTSPFQPHVVRGAVGHDWLYRTGTDTRRKADMWFRMAVREDMEDAWTHERFRRRPLARLWERCVARHTLPWLLWLGVRLGGWLFWGQCRSGLG